MREVVVTAPDVGSAREVARRLWPDAEIVALEDAGPADADDVARFRQIAKATTFQRPGEIRDISIRKQTA
ncbi:hypothetical protein [Thiohalocapsa marina]|uniref:hypothetical protein n=1 Tax=Thiohalocapsa marina TaxID=424902 RepID=UPI0036DE2C55